MENERKNPDMENKIKQLQMMPTEEHLWEAVAACQGLSFFTYSGLEFRYELRYGRNGEYNKELWIDRREKSKSLSWSSVMLAFQKIKNEKILVDRPKALGDIRGVTYIYAIFFRFGLIDVPEHVRDKMRDGKEC